ncbi:small, acid-soluble spore protein, alpha/beta type [Salipaludibacillus neizhouensis]|uniref:Small, acid-soluble spore protein, alpha/beta type n=1 Tax=Salipaludibacillus neizhouensis TaxID=885475 RepID=A0A3A9KAG4_9BACI|nr:small, acid-soluble spore protein, alpha/beta type [Salipaludibacillus neizhouensis]RKL67441.1 small, acid-soluble spore protein, alpha/beta type [Salipaludibacillus neizhouensis]
MVESNKLLVPGIEKALDKMKYEIAEELGVDPSGDSSQATEDMTKRLVSESQQATKNDQ